MSAPPQKLGKYRLLERLAVGGMAEIYLAVAEGMSGFEKQVVVKRLLPQHLREQDLLTMFVDEARLLARLRHRNIAEVYDIGQEGDELFIALEYVCGSDLREILRANGDKALPLDEAVWIITSVADGLDHAHGLTADDGAPLGIVHRDVSPSNVVVAQDGTVKLIDFGVAKWSAQRSETRHGTLKGKVHYMSPEQCKGEVLDRRSDVFALGVLLYELTTGQRPFAGGSDLEVLNAITAGKAAPPSQRVPGYPAQLESIVMAALAGARDVRCPTAAQLAAELRAFAAGQAIVAGPQALAKRALELHAREQTTRRGFDSQVENAAADLGQRQVPPALDRTLTAGAEARALGTDRNRTRSASIARKRRRAFAWAGGLSASLAVLIATAWVAATATPRNAPPVAPEARAAADQPEAVAVPPVKTAETPAIKPDVAAPEKFRTRASKAAGPAVAAPAPSTPDPDPVVAAEPGPPSTEKPALLPPLPPDAGRPVAPGRPKPKVWDPDSPIPP